MKHQKRAEGRTLVIMIIVIASAMVLILFGGKLYAAITGGASDNACRLSIFAQSKLKGFTGKSPVSIECPRKEIIFYKDHVEEHIEGKSNNIKIKIGEKLEKKFKELDDVIVNQVIAEELRRCWYKTGEGELDAFDEGGLLGTETCLLCSTIEFDDEVINAGTVPFPDLMIYLENNKISPKGEEISYLDYLSKVKTARGFMWIPIQYKTFYQEEVDKIEPGKKYVVFMKSFKTSQFQEKILQFPDTYWVLVGPEELIARKGVCNILLN